MREIIFDTETTGLDPASGHKIVELGCVELVDKIRTGNVYHKYVNPQRDVPKASENVHGLSTDFLMDKPVFKEVAQEFIDFVASDKLVIHNASFDMRFINHELKEAGFSVIPFERAIDTLDIARKKFPGAKASLDALCQRFSISLDKRDKHGALLDSELLADVYIELMGGVQNSMKLDTLISHNAQPVGLKKKARKSRTFEPSQAEIEAHQAFLEKIKEPLWQ